MRRASTRRKHRATRRAFVSDSLRQDQSGCLPHGVVEAGKNVANATHSPHVVHHCEEQILYYALQLKKDGYRENIISRVKTREIEKRTDVTCALAFVKPCLLVRGSREDLLCKMAGDEMSVSDFSQFGYGSSQTSCLKTHLGWNLNPTGGLLRSMPGFNTN